MTKNQLNMIPAFVANSYRLYNATLLNIEICLLYSLDCSLYSPAQIQKQMQLVKNKLSLPVIFIFENMVSYNIQRLVAQRINFIVPDKQMFIPDLLIDLKKQKTTADQSQLSIQPIAQCILLYHLEINSLSNKTTREISTLFNISYSNANRAIRWLTDKNIVILTDTKEKKLNFQTNGKNLWNKISTYLISPVERVVYTDERIIGTCISGINALASYSMLNDEPSKYYALSKDELKKISVHTDNEYGNKCYLTDFAKNYIIIGGAACDVYESSLTIVPIIYMIKSLKL